MGATRNVKKKTEAGLITKLRHQIKVKFGRKMKETETEIQFLAVFKILIQSKN